MTTILFLAACAHTSVGLRTSQYTEVSKIPMDQYLAQNIPAGVTMTTSLGNADRLNLSGTGVQFGSFTPFATNWDFDVGLAFQSYPSLSYTYSYTSNSTSGSGTMKYDITGLSLDLAVGYRWNWLRPYLGLRRDVYTMIASSGLYMDTMYISQISAVGGLEATYPLTSAMALSLKGDYATSISKDSNTKSANTMTAQLNLVWGLGNTR